MTVTDIDMLRDGGTIIFRIGDSPLRGQYLLQTPWRGVPRPLFQDDRRLDLGSDQEIQVLNALRVWLENHVTPALADALTELDQLPIWQNLPEKLDRAVSFHRIRSVVRCLQERVA